MSESITIPSILNGCRFIRVAKQGKVATDPNWQTFNNFGFGENLITSHLEVGGNYGVLPTNGIGILDIDDYQTAIELGILDVVSHTFTVKTGNGYHYFFKITGDNVPSKKIPIFNPKNTKNHVGELFFPGCSAYVVGPGSTHPSGAVYQIVQDGPMLEISMDDIEIKVLSKVHYTKKETGIKKEIVNRDNVSISDALNLQVISIFPPNNGTQTGEEVIGEHPIHGSSTGHNYSVNLHKNQWHCFRCNSGGGPLEAVAVKHGLITCDQAGQIPIKGDLFKQVKEILADCEGYADHISALDAEYKKNELTTTDKKQSGKKQETQPDGEEEIKRHLPFFEKCGSLFLTCISKDDRYSYCRLEGDTVVFTNQEIDPVGVLTAPPQLPVHQDRGSTVYIVGLPRSDLIATATLLSPQEIYDKILQHFNKYFDAPALDCELFCYYALYSWFYSKCSTAPYLRFLGDTGKGKSRFLKVISDLCFYPIRASGSSSLSGLMRTKERWGGTLLIDESDLKGDQSDPLIKYLNLGFEKDNFFLLTDKNDVSKQHIFDPFGPKTIAMRQPFRDIATEGRCLSFSPNETTREDIPPELPSKYFEEVAVLRAHITRFVLEHWSEVSEDCMLSCNGMRLEKRLQQMARPMSIILKIFPDGEERFRSYLTSRQREIKQTRSDSFEGMLFNYALQLATGEEDLLLNQDFAQYYRNAEIQAITPAMLASACDVKPASVTRALKGIGMDVKTKRMTFEDKGNTKSKTPKVILVPNKQKWNEIIQRYYISDDGCTIPDCPPCLKGDGFRGIDHQVEQNVSLVSDVSLSMYTHQHEGDVIKTISDDSRCVLVQSETTETTETFQNLQEWRTHHLTPALKPPTDYTTITGSVGSIRCTCRGCSEKPQYAVKGLQPLCQQHFNEYQALWAKEQGGSE